MGNYAVVCLFGAVTYSIFIVFYNGLHAKFRILNNLYASVLGLLTLVLFLGFSILSKVAFVINEAEQRNLTETAAEIQQLLEQLDKSYSTDTTAGKMAIATEAIKQIESNPTLMKRIISAAKAGSISALEAALNHPAASFAIGAIEDWQNY